MKRDSAFCLACFLGFIFLLLSSVFIANAAPKGKPEKPKVEIMARAVKADTGRKDAKGKAVTREFPVMFDIAKRAQDKRAQKQKKGADKK